MVIMPSGKYTPVLEKSLVELREWSVFDTWYPLGYFRPYMYINVPMGNIKDSNKGSVDLNLVNKYIMITLKKFYPSLYLLKTHPSIFIIQNLIKIKKMSRYIQKQISPKLLSNINVK